MKATQKSATAATKRSSGAQAKAKRPDRAVLRRQVIVHLNELGYTTPAPDVATSRMRPEVRRRNPYRGSLVYGATVVTKDLTDPKHHERLVFFANRRTTKRAAIQLYIGVATVDLEPLETLLEQLGVRTHARGGNVQLVIVDD